MPFFSVSCNSNDPGVTLSGFELSTGKTIGDEYYSGNFLGFILIAPSAAMLLWSVYIYDTKKAFLYNIYKTALFIVPVFNIFAAFILRHIFKAVVLNRSYSQILRYMPNLSPETVYSYVNLQFGVKYGFILYILLNAAVFAFASAHYFMKRE